MTTAKQVLDYHVDLWRRMDHDKGTRDFFDAFIQAVLRAPYAGLDLTGAYYDGADQRPVDPDDPDLGVRKALGMFWPATDGAEYAAQLAIDLHAARTYQVTEDMMSVVTGLFDNAKADHDFRQGKLHEEELPYHQGFVWFDSPWVHSDVYGKAIATRAMSWALVSLRRGERGVRVVLWQLIGDHDDYTDEINRTLAEAGRQPGWIGPLEMTHSQVLGFGEPYRNMLAVFTGTLWALMSMEITTDEPAELDRHTLRRARDIRHPEVRVVELRRSGDGPPRAEGDTQHVDWSCRWIVRGHFRRAPDGGTFKDGRAVTFVRPYIKGPDGKPLRSAADVLYRLGR